MEAIDLEAIRNRRRSMRPLRPGLIAAAAAFGLMSSFLMSCARLNDVTHDKDYTALGAKLAKDMSERDVANTLGGTPDKADLATCTDHEGKQWQCRTWIFGGGKPKNNLRVVFYQADDSTWRVVTWDMF
jgi:hypothetical protein